MSGAELLRQISADSDLKNTRVIVASADAHAAVDFEDDADLVLSKPVSVSDLGDLATHLATLN